MGRRGKNDTSTLAEIDRTQLVLGVCEGILFLCCRRLKQNRDASGAAILAPPRSETGECQLKAKAKITPSFVIDLVKIGICIGWVTLLAVLSVYTSVSVVWV